MRAKLVNEAIKHLTPQSDTVIDNDTFATITLYTRTGLFIKNKRLDLNRQNNNIYSKDFDWLGKDIKTLNEFIAALKDIIKSDINAGNIYEIKIWKTTKTITWGAGRTLLFTIDNADEQGYLDEGIKHLKPVNREEVKKRLREMFNNGSFISLGEKYEKYNEYPVDRYKELLESYEKLAEAMDSNMADIHIIEDLRGNDFLGIDTFFEVLAYKSDIRINIPFEEGLFHVYPEVKIAYSDNDNYNPLFFNFEKGNAWFFDLPYIIKNLNKYIHIFAEEKITESIKHLKPISKEQIEFQMKDYGLYDKFFTAVKENMPDVIKQLIDSGEYKKLEPADIKVGFLTAANYGYVEIVKMLLDNGADPGVVNIGWIDDSVVPLIKQYRRIRRLKNKR